MTKNWIKIGVYSFCNKTFIGRWFLGLSRSLSTFRGTQTIPIRQPATFNESTTPSLTLARWLPWFLLSHPYITGQCPKQQTKGRGKSTLSSSFPFWERARIFPEAPADSSWYLIGRNKVTWPTLAARRTERKERSISLFYLRKWAVPGGNGWVSLPPHQAWGERNCLQEPSQRWEVGLLSINYGTSRART